MPATKATKWKGLNDGVTSEWTLVATVKPGHEQALRDYAATRIKEARETGYENDVVIPVGTVHDYRWVFLDKGTKIMFMSNFDGDWGAYIDDFFATKLVGESFDNILSFCEGYDRNASVSTKKEYMQAHTIEAALYTRAYHGTVKEMWKAQELQKAFQHVLDDPAAAKALAQTPALKPLLDLAAK